IQIQHNYFYGTQNAATHTYAIETYGSADNLVQNNIFQHVTAPMVIDNTEGTVFAYNYSTDDYYNVSGWMIPSIVIHAGGVGMILFEGNDGSGLEADAIHGTSDFVTGTSRFGVSEVPSVLSQFANPVPPNNILPASLYLSAKPSWFGSGTWPPIGPDVTGGQDPTGHAYNIPSKLCYNNTAKD